MIGERLRTLADLVAGIEVRVRAKPTLRIFPRRVRRQTVRFVRDLPLGHVDPADTIALEVVHGAFRTVDGQFVEVRTAEAEQLRVRVGEKPSLQQRIVREVDPRDDVAGMERHLFGFGEEVVGIAVEHHPAERRQRHHLLGNQLRGIEDVERKARRRLFIERLHRELVLRVVAHGDGLEEVAPLRIGVGAVELHGLVPDERLRADLRAPMKLHERRFTGRGDEAKRVDAEAFHHPERSGERAIRHRPQNHVEALRHQRHEVPERIVGRPRLWIPAIGLHFHGMHEVGKLDRVLDEEHRDVVADQIEVAFLGIELHREAAHIARCVARSGAAGHGGEADEHRRFLLGVLQERGTGQPDHRLVGLKVPVGG